MATGLVWADTSSADCLWCMHITFSIIITTLLLEVVFRSENFAVIIKSTSVVSNGCCCKIQNWHKLSYADCQSRKCSTRRWTPPPTRSLSVHWRLVTGTCWW